MHPGVPFAGLDRRATDLVAALLMGTDPWWQPGALDQVAAFCQGYGRRIVVTEPELAAVPGLIRERLVGSAVWRAGRWRAGLSDLADVRDRIRTGLDVDTWLDDHADELLAAIAPFPRGSPPA